MLHLSAQGAAVFGTLKEMLKHARNLSQEGVKKHNIDLMLASTALTEQCTLVSADSIYREIQKLHRGLMLENWLL